MTLGVTQSLFRSWKALSHFIFSLSIDTSPEQERRVDLNERLLLAFRSDPPHVFCFFFFSGTGQNLHRALKIEKIKHWQMAVTFYTGHVVPCHLTWQPSQKRNRGEITAAVSHFLSPLSAPLAPRHAFAPSIGSTWGESAVLVIMFNLFPTVSPVFLCWIIKAAWSRLLHTSSARAKPSEGTNMRADEEKQQ